MMDGQFSAMISPLFIHTLMRPAVALISIGPVPHNYYALVMILISIKIIAYYFNGINFIKKLIYYVIVYE